MARTTPTIYVTIRLDHTITWTRLGNGPISNSWLLFKIKERKKKKTRNMISF